MSKTSRLIILFLCIIYVYFSSAKVGRPVSFRVENLLFRDHDRRALCKLVKFRKIFVQNWPVKSCIINLCTYFKTYFSLLGFVNNFGSFRLAVVWPSYSVELRFMKKSDIRFNGVSSRDVCERNVFMIYYWICGSREWTLASANVDFMGLSKEENQDGKTSGILFVSLGLFPGYTTIYIQYRYRYFVW